MSRAKIYEIGAEDLGSLPEAVESTVGARSEYEPTDEGEEDLVIIELDRGDGFSGELRKAEIRDCRSRGCIGWERANFKVP